MQSTKCTFSLPFFSALCPLSLTPCRTDSPRERDIVEFLTVSIVARNVEFPKAEFLKPIGNHPGVSQRREYSVT
jgi:hypothetical protein